MAKKTRIEFIKGKSLAMLAQERRDLEKAQGGKLDDQFILALYVDYMSDPNNRIDPKAMILFATAYSCDIKQLRKWSVDPTVQAEIRKVVRERFGGGERVRELYDLLWEQARQGRISAIRLGLEVTGEYTPKLQHVDRPKNLEDYLDKMDQRDAKEDAGEVKATRH
jgi:hypothetical protein